MRSPRVSAFIACVLVVCVLVAAAPAVPLGGRAPTAAGAAGGPGYVVSMGDSFISGEAGRWAGNTATMSPSVHDALGPDAYWDNPTHTAERTVGCHRSESAEVHIGHGVPSINIACSGATTSTAGGKPGIDFYDSAGLQGQALILQQFASNHDVDMIVVSIGGNDFGFSSIITSCVIDFITSTAQVPNYCSDDPSVSANFTPDNVAAKTTAIRNALDRIRLAMSNAGYAQSSYTIVVQTYPSPMPTAAGIRYPETVSDRFNTGGCAFWNADADWANTVALPTINSAVRDAVTQAGGTNIKVLNVDNAFNGRRLCETGTALYEEQWLPTYSWTTPGAVDNREWVNRIRPFDASPYQMQESFHPGYWGQLALRNCVRFAYNKGIPQGGTCARQNKTGLNADGEPNMKFVP